MRKQAGHERVWAGLNGLHAELRRIVDREPEQDVRGLAIPVLDALLGEAKEFLGDDPIVDRVEDIISPQAVASGDTIRAVDVLLVVRMLLDRIDRPPMDVVFEDPF